MKQATIKVKASDKKDDGVKKKQERSSAATTLTSLVGVDLDKMTDKQFREFVGVLGKAAGYLDDKNKVKPL